MEVKRFETRASFACNVYVCKSEKGNFIVDPGYYDLKMLSYIKSIGGIDFILITHGHFDHIYGVNTLVKEYPNVEIYAHKDEIEVINDPRKNCSYLYDGSKLTLDGDIIPLDEGKMKIKDHQIFVLHTPGHTKGGAIYIFHDEQVVFTGDTIICESIGRYDLPTSSENKLYDSINKFKKLNIPSTYRAYFGHGESYTFEKLYKVNIYLK